MFFCWRWVIICRIWHSDSRVLQPYWFADESLSFPSNNLPRKTIAIPKEGCRMLQGNGLEDWRMAEEELWVVFLCKLCILEIPWTCFAVSRLSQAEDLSASEIETAQDRNVWDIQPLDGLVYHVLQWTLQLLLQLDYLKITSITNTIKVSTLLVYNLIYI